MRQNHSGGKVLTQFDATIASANELVLDFPNGEPPPAMHSLAIVIPSAGPRSAFLAHTHTMAQILGLLDALAGVYSRLDVLRDGLIEGADLLRALLTALMDSGASAASL